MKPIEVKHLKFSYDQETDVVRDVSFSVERGSYTTIIGHNGSGKSTIAKLLIGLLEKEEGEILIDGAPLTLENLAAIRSKVGIVFQNPDNQFIGATVRDDIAFGLENHNVDPKEMDGIIERFAQEVNMTSYLNHEPTRLSGGQKQRVAIAGVLAMSPEILILDEATSMLDPEGKGDVNELVDQLHHSRNMTILSITHDIEEVRKSDHVLVMNEGQIVMDGDPDVILHRYADLVKLRLDAPFSVKLALELKKLGIVLDNPMDEEGMVDQLCRLHLKK
ncbi:MAG: energy-coupling factor transporter ATPase [Firmicutes bacterium GWF2_51_9]|nr:MAG: energy-coupling factor transporter ATPase [Firmicutes bacterium GWF2_51_9]OGS58959.1 MAG: energy-coupling factor transporter ATPase [Firmicutes bacterium GWE2_51_13]HAM63430.1 energy-coupling factor transporter ATPase [Erysipelotrichaceae bacterium]HAO61898.1 energy-coupling factor transporter ATPase [Erysipelotrichaceae bacterium]HBZ40533.1 energy-coupling factor transporter ATPase [Erysipelotrichaceae bacterium]